MEQVAVSRRSDALKHAKERDDQVSDRHGLRKEARVLE